MYSPLSSSLALRSVVDVNEPPKYEGLADAEAEPRSARNTRRAVRAEAVQDAARRLEGEQFSHKPETKASTAVIQRAQVK